MTDWYSAMVAESDLPPDAARQLHDLGFAVLPGATVQGGWARLAEAYDRAVSAADPADVSVRASTRVHDFVNQGPEFDELYVYRPLLTACRRIIGRPFKLSTMLARTLEPGTPAQPLHVDVRRNADGWPLVGFIVMVDAFHAGNGATRFVPGSHLGPRDPDESEDTTGPYEGDVLACGPAGSVIIFNGSVWHGYTANRSTRRRRSIQGAFIPREARAAIVQAARMRPETFARIGDLAKYVLAVGPTA
jgi:ectoine hydroxylase-related dioxygenase (phytanoyl-CoA dioxygenase family)